MMIENINCDYNISPVIEKPFPHVIKSEFIEPDLYQILKNSFPQLPKNGGRTGYSLYQHHSEYERFINSHEEWQTLYNSLMRLEFIEYITLQFRDYFEKNGCRINPERARYIDFIETPEMVTNKDIDSNLAPEDLFVRVDIQQGKPGYSKKVHCDFMRRFATCLIYFCDSDEIEIKGGELGIHTSDHNLYTKIQPRDNLAIIFPRWPNSFHSALPIISTKKPRNFLYIAISSTVSLWPA